MSATEVTNLVPATLTSEFPEKLSERDFLRIDSDPCIYAVTVETAHLRV